MNEPGREANLIRRWVAKLFDVHSLSDFISIRGFFVSFGGLLLLAGLIKTLHWLFGRVLRWWRGDTAESGLLTTGAAYYRRMAELLAECGLERPPAETQSEFARRAFVFLTGRGSATETVADVPTIVVDAFYKVRFGHVELDEDDLTKLDSRLDSLETTLHNGQA